MEFAASEYQIIRSSFIVSLFRSLLGFLGKLLILLWRQQNHCYFFRQVHWHKVNVDNETTVFFHSKHVNFIVWISSTFVSKRAIIKRRASFCFSNFPEIWVYLKTYKRILAAFQRSKLQYRNVQSNCLFIFIFSSIYFSGFLEFNFYTCWFTLYKFENWVLRIKTT